jgi:hypothetical protein
MELLSGWKEIAEHLHLTVRTAQRWERLGLPVRRVSESPCSPVVAIPDELEQWARTRDVKEDAALLASNKSLVNQLADLRQAQTRTRRRTRKLLARINYLGNEQKKLIFSIQSNLNSPPQLEGLKISESRITNQLGETEISPLPRNPVTIFATPADR